MKSFKKRIKNITALLLAVITFLSAFVINSAAAGFSSSLSGPDIVRAGDKISVTFRASGSGLSAIMCKFSYDTSILSYSGTASKRNGWACDDSASGGIVSVLASDDKLTNPINDSANVFVMTFKVSNSAAAGKAITISDYSISASNGTNDFSGSASYSVKLSAPLSGNTRLASLTVSNATLFPDFSPTVYEYYTSVGFDVERLQISAKAEDPDAKVSVNSPDLKAGGDSYASVTVTAGNGTKKMYSIKVTRAQDPNYVPSNISTLSELTVDGFLLSPVFEANRLEYMIFLPNEVESVVVSAVPADGLAVATVENNEGFIVGDNTILVTCVAEDGTSTVYKIIARREETVEGILHPTEPTIPAPTVTLPAVTEPPAKEFIDYFKDEYPLWYFSVGGALLLIIGALLGFTVDKKKKIKKALEKSRGEELDNLPLIDGKIEFPAALPDDGKQEKNVEYNSGKDLLDELYKDE